MNPPPSSGGDRPRQRFVPVFVALVLAIASSQGGCVALSLPSERHHDPADHGGMFGSWRGPVRPGRWLQHAVAGTPLDAEVAVSCGRHDGGFPAAPCTCGGDEGEWAPAPPDPDVPWPRYHPVPTRPLFGTPLPNG